MTLCLLQIKLNCCFKTRHHIWVLLWFLVAMRSSSKFHMKENCLIKNCGYCKRSALNIQLFITPLHLLSLRFSAFWQSNFSLHISSLFKINFFRVSFSQISLCTLSTENQLIFLTTPFKLLN